MKKITGIEIVMGKPGVGKSTYLAKIAKLYLDKGIPVWSNVPIAGTYKFNLKEDVMKYEISQGLVIIDEAGIEMDARQWKTFGENLVEFFKMHRHYNLRIVVATQFWDDIDKKVRLLAQRIYILYPTIFGITHLCLKEVTCHVGISEQKEIVEQYQFKPWYIGGLHYFYKRDAWRMFDTHLRRDLTSRNWSVWSEYIHQSIFEKFTNSFKNWFSKNIKMLNIKFRS